MRVGVTFLTPDQAWSIHTVVLFLGLLWSAFSYNNGTIRVIPRFTEVPPPVTYFSVNPSTESSLNQVDLVCRAWPPNAKLYILGSHVTGHFPYADHSCGTSGSELCPNNPSTFLSLPQGLGIQLYGLLRITNTSPSDGLSSAQAQRDLIIHESLADAVRERPSAAPADEIAVRLNVNTLSELRQLESLRLYCLASTAFGHILSSPFRVRPTSLGEFPSSNVSSGVTSVQNVDVWVNNVASVDCVLPANSLPTPLVHFELNGTLISDAALQSDKYRLVWRPDGRSASLLIHRVQAQDCGTYRCVITNPLTGEKKYTPESTRLNLIIPQSPVLTRIVVPLAPNSSPNSNGATSTTRSLNIVVEEGQNVTLFCIIQGAPPPTVIVYPFEQNATLNGRFLADRKFGFLRITNVQLKDAGFYICADSHITSTAQMQVKRRLRLLTQPEDVRLVKLGGRVQFKCATSDPQVTPFWLFNGQLKPNRGNGEGNTLVLTNVTAQNLGVYQCVAQRKTDTLSGTDEWVSSSAILSLESDRILRTAHDLAAYIPPRPADGSAETTPEVTTAELTPQAQVLYDNLAVFIVWQPLTVDQSDVSQPKVVEYRVEYSVQTSPVEELQGSLNNSETNAALIGLVGHPAVRWDEPKSLDKPVAMTFAYVTDAILKPLRRYRFRVVAVDPSTGVALTPPSDWSNVVSTEHISPVEPPLIKAVRPLSQGRVHVMWAFDFPSSSASVASVDSPMVSSSNSPSGLLSPSLGPAATSQTNTIFPLEPNLNLFVPDHFLVLARPIVKPSGQLDSIKYGPYWATQVNGSNARETILTGLNRTARYQIIVFGVRGTGDRRQITRFSNATFVNLASADHTGEYSLLRSLTSNRLMYLILGGIAALMFFVVFVFILLCLCRQQRERRVTDQQKKQNGFVQNFKDASGYMPVATSDATDGRRQSSAGTISNHGHVPGTQMLMMNNLQCSNFSDQSGMNHQATAAMLQQQQADHYAAQMAKEMMIMKQQQQQQQQQHSVIGSQMHLQQQSSIQQQQQQQQIYHPQHHQSHHSLLLPSGTVVPGSHASSNAMYQSGTLPGGPRYMRQQFGSQQPLNRATTPANMLEMTEFYHQQQQPQQVQTNVYAHQQPQLPPLPVVNNGALHHQMMYYPGPVTPNGTSVTREPPTGGSLHDASAYGTLLQRGHLTGSMINDRSSIMMSPHPNSAYFHGSQQALHMMQYPNNVGTPQATHAAMQSPRPQQQAAYFASHQHYPGYYGQHPDGVLHGPHGFVHADGESVYSYFSQQDMGQPNHQPLNPLPEENQNHLTGGLGYVDSGMQTAEMNGLGNSAGDGSPAGPGSHRHHRRRRRKQQRQESDLPNGSGTNGSVVNESSRQMDDGPPMSEQPGDAQLDEQQPLELSGQKRHRSLSGAGTYSDADPMSGQHSFTSPQSYHADSNRTGYIRYGSPQRGQISSGQLPPPNQPPPPPPPPSVAGGLVSPAFANGLSGDQHPGYLTQPGVYHHSTADSLSRRAYPSALSGPNSGLLVGPPPRMRDYSEYGIPQGVGLPPTAAGGQPLPSQHNALMGNPATGNMVYVGRYREGQA